MAKVGLSLFVNRLFGKLIHSADPHVHVHVVRLSASTSVRPHFSNLAKQNNRK